MKNPTPNEALAIALDLAQHGLHVFPCTQKKCPSWPKKKGGQGFHDASTDPDAIRAMWRSWPGTLIGVRTGENSDLSVLDLDLQHDSAVAWYSEHRGELAQYPANETRSGGMHVLFRHGAGIGNSAGRIASHVDVRGEGGYIIWWPACGFGRINEGMPLVGMPEWLLQSMEKPAPSRVRRDPSVARPVTDRYIGKAIERAFETVAMAPPGQRNDTLNRQTYSLSRFIETGIITSADIAHAMTEAGIVAGLDDKEIDATIQSALRGRLASNG